MAERTVEDVYAVVIEIKEQLALRRHFDEMVLMHQEAIKGNGKPGMETQLALAAEREQKRDRREWFIFTTLFLEVLGLVFALAGA